MMILSLLLIIAGFPTANAQGVNATLERFQQLNRAKPRVVCETQSKPDQNICSDLLSQYLRLRSTLWDLYKNPQAHGFDGPFGDAFEKKCDQTELDLTAIGMQCLEKQFQTCYPESSLKSEIDPSELNAIFARLKTDFHYRMRDPAALCLDRAKRLALLFSKKGIATQIIQIDQAPVLISPLLDRKGHYLEHYIDYHGTHYVVSLKVAPSHEEYILDPQFSEAPIPRDQYFILTTGSICTEGARPSDRWKCNYKKHLPTFIAPDGQKFRPQKSSGRYATQGDFIESVLNGKQKANCGFIVPKDDSFFFSSKNSPVTNDKDPLINNKIRAQLIVANLENDYQETTDTHADASTFKNHVTQVCKNLNLTSMECTQIRSHYQSYLQAKIN